MTYCVGLRLKKGLLFMSDTRTNSGVDNVSTFKKMFSWAVPGDRVITILTAGNLGTTQSLVSLLDERSRDQNFSNGSILQAPSFFQVARIVGETLKEVILENSEVPENSETSFGATIILGGQIASEKSKLFLVYPEGNFIEASKDTPFFQSGEIKYGRPILLRAFNPDMEFEEAIKLLLVSFDSTLKANLSVGLPLDLQIYYDDTLESGYTRRFEASDLYYINISSTWGEALRQALQRLPDFNL